MTDVKKIWNDVISKDLQGHGIKVFIAFLTAHPEEQAKFTKFASVPLGSLAGNSDVAVQSLTVMNQLGKYINCSNLASETKALGVSHVKLGVKRAQFEKIFPSIAEYAATNAGGSKADWQKALDAIGEAIYKNQ